MITHFEHPLYAEAVCGEAAFNHPEFAAEPSCLRCVAWRAAPHPPATPMAKAWPVDPERPLRPGDSFEVSATARMVAVEPIVIAVVQRTEDGAYYAGDEQGRWWPMDHPPWMEDP